MSLPPKYRSKKSKPYVWKPPVPVRVPREFELGLSRMSSAQAGRASGIRDTVSFANRQAVNDSTQAFVVLDQANAGLARPLSSRQVMTDYGDAVKAALGQTTTAASLGRLRNFRTLAAYTGGYVSLGPGRRLLNFGDYRATLPPGARRLL